MRAARIGITAVGAFPKPEYVPVPDWFRGEATPASSALPGADARTHVERGIREAVRVQVAAGVDVPTDGEIGRENYIHYHCRHLTGIDFTKLRRKVARAGTWDTRVPTVVGPVAAGEPFLPADYAVAQAAADRPVKMTMPGPLTIMDSTADGFYGSPLDLGHALAEALNDEARALAAAGCTHVQIDEPVFARYPDRALSYGFELLEAAFAGLDGSVTRTVHICCGYPDRLDSPHYPKADPAAYFELADAVEASSVDAVSLEDAHRPNDLALFERFATTTVVLGAARIATSGVEQVDEVAGRVEAVLGRVPAERLWLAPDCGLGMLPPPTALAKLRVIRAAADFVMGTPA